MSAPETPTLDKITEVRVQADAIGEFLEWLLDKYVLCDPIGDDDHIPALTLSIEHLMADYFDIDLAAANRERDKVLEYVRDLANRA